LKPVSAAPRAGCEGFTLLELAVALLLMGLLFGSMFMPIQQQLESRRTEATSQLLRQAREALLGYAAANGYFPCPSDAASGGREPPASDHATGSCPAYFGWLPGAALGLPATDAQGYAVDGWPGSANRIRYAVAKDTVGAVASPFTRINGMRTATIASLADSALSLFHVCGSASGVVAGTSCGSAGTLVSSAPVVVWSVGPNAARGGASADEAENPNPNGGSADRMFVSRTRSDVEGREFDDQLQWVPMPVLVARMVAAGHLP
jgi:prepilin-type N-terminal cleavage/methylation domain-containing protein